MIRRFTGVLLLLTAIAAGACAAPPESQTEAEGNEELDQRARDVVPMGN
jgi:hypothetical protein